MCVICAYANITHMTDKNQIKRFKDFLDSDTTKSKITKALLIVIAITSIPIIVTGGVAMGNTVRIFKMFNKTKRYKKEQISQALRGLRINKFIEYITDHNGVTTIRITKKGKSNLKAFSVDLLEIKNQKKWDGKWRVIMFDLPIQYKKIRNSFRFKLKQIGFLQLQKSVWIYPYPCTDELLFIADYYKVGKYIEILTVEEMLNIKNLENRFNL